MIHIPDRRPYTNYVVEVDATALKKFLSTGKIYEVLSQRRVSEYLDI